MLKIKEPKFDKFILSELEKNKDFLLDVNSKKWNIEKSRVYEFDIMKLIKSKEVLKNIIEKEEFLYSFFIISLLYVIYKEEVGKIWEDLESFILFYLNIVKDKGIKKYQKILKKVKKTYKEAFPQYIFKDEYNFIFPTIFNLQDFKTDNLAIWKEKNNIIFINEKNEDLLEKKWSSLKIFLELTTLKKNRDINFFVWANLKTHLEAFLNNVDDKKEQIFIGMKWKNTFSWKFFLDKNLVNFMRDFIFQENWDMDRMKLFIMVDFRNRVHFVFFNLTWLLNWKVYFFEMLEAKGL